MVGRFELLPTPVSPWSTRQPSEPEYRADLGPDRGSTGPAR